jgi:hypothetical protein
MMNRVIVMGVVAWAGAIAACSSSGDSSSGPQLAVQGTVSKGVQVDNARAVAIGTDGSTYWAYLNDQRDFTLTLPVGQSYRLVIANARQGGGQAIVGHLVVPSASGGSSWLGANQPGTLDLGTLKLAWQGADDDDDGSHHHHDHDGECHHGGHHGGGGGDDTCEDEHGHDEELSPTKHPGEECRDHDGHDDDDDGHHHCHDGGGDHEPPCPMGDGGHAGDAGSNADAGGGGNDAGSGGGVGAECLTNADCMPGLMCVAGLCSL